MQFTYTQEKKFTKQQVHEKILTLQQMQGLMFFVKGVVSYGKQFNFRQLCFRWDLQQPLVFQALFLSALEHFCGLRKQNDWWQYKMDNKKLFRIGEMAKLFHLSVQTLRHCQLPTT